MPRRSPLRLEQLSLASRRSAVGPLRKDVRAPTRVAEVPYIRTANVQAGYSTLRLLKTLPVTADQRSKHRLEHDDVLVLKAVTPTRSAEAGCRKSRFQSALHQNHVFAVRTDREQLLPRYLAYSRNAPLARRYFLGCAKQTTNLASINKKQLRALPVPVPDVRARRRCADARTQTSAGDALART